MQGRSRFRVTGGDSSASRLTPKGFQRRGRRGIWISWMIDKFKPVGIIS